MIVVTAATGKLGVHVVEGLLAKVPASDIAVVVRNPDKAKAFAAKGIEVRAGDYAKPASLSAAFRAGDKVLLISSSEVGQRAEQHGAVIAAAKAAGVALLVYTSILHADGSSLALAAEHVITEAAIRASGLPYVFLRNGWYLENYTENLASALAHGVLMGSAGQGKIAAASRADFAGAAVAVLTSEGSPNTIYELAGDAPFTMSELAAVVAEQIGKPVAYQDMPVADYEAALVGFGVPGPFAHLLADSDAGIAKGQLDDGSHTLSKLIGRPTQALRAAVAAAVAAKLAFGTTAQPAVDGLQLAAPIARRRGSGIHPRMAPRLVRSTHQSVHSGRPCARNATGSRYASCPPPFERLAPVCFGRGSPAQPLPPEAVSGWLAKCATRKSRSAETLRGRWRVGG